MAEEEIEDQELLRGFSALEVDEARQRYNAFQKVMEKCRGEMNDSDSSEASTVYKYRRSRRKKKRVNYMEVEEPRMDRLFWCDPCDKSFRKACSVHGPLLVIPNNEDKSVCGSLGSIPKGWLVVGPSSIPGGGLGVFAPRGLPPRVQLGPYEGVLTKKPDPTSNYIWQIECRDGNKKMYVDGKDRNNSSWLRFVNCARHVTEQNLQAFQHKEKMYYRTVCLIRPGTELLVYYGPQFAKTLGIKQDEYFAPLKTPLEISPHALMKPQIIPQKEKISKLSTAGQDDHKERKHKCNVCEMGFTQNGNLTRHMRIHTGEKPYKCNVCEMAFTCSGPLTAHMRIHTGEKPYKCNVCEMGFSKSSHLTVHMRIHTGEKPYKCDVCDMGFRQKSDLTKHMRTHTGEKPYKCNVCEMAFTQSSNLTTHMRIHNK